MPGTANTAPGPSEVLSSLRLLPGTEFDNVECDAEISAVIDFGARGSVKIRAVEVEGTQ
jgi:hypothetical protein